MGLRAPPPPPSGAVFFSPNHLKRCVRPQCPVQNLFASTDYIKLTAAARHHSLQTATALHAASPATAQHMPPQSASRPPPSPLPSFGNRLLARAEPETRIWAVALDPPPALQGGQKYCDEAQCHDCRWHPWYN